MTDVPQGKRSTKGDQVTYGPFQDVEPFDDGGELKLHYVSSPSLDNRNVNVISRERLTGFSDEDLSNLDVL